MSVIRIEYRRLNHIALLYNSYAQHLEHIYRQRELGHELHKEQQVSKKARRASGLAARLSTMLACPSK